ncbi:sensor histidine kinase [Helcococcus kunzii]|uniref:sensor histidine kinase n=1 Tax=Helcococcus kunzii TaxID=40091 RepID=UPI001C989793|nr:ATP-binding protein [Helcococcus kunzii]MCT1796350.1 ATP-binding protein [Helcococcus kunzii]MCT1989020.1 ATP-binding protein [Helcococcus kunzii]QZO76579.1 sensor histidine kinase [Helcococcus kunzii]
MNFFNRLKLYFNKKEIIEYQQNLLNTHYQEVENMYKDIRKWRHNYRNHLQILNAYAENDDLQSIKKYLKELDDNLHSIAPVIRTGNKMTDAIVNSKVSISKANEIKTVVDVNISQMFNISEVDLATIIGNLFDNAIEALMELPPEERYIRLYMTMKGPKLYISFTNFTAQKKQKKFGNIFKSTKGINRGLGLVSVDEIIERYDGYISRNSEDNAFTTEVLL